MPEITEGDIDDQLPFLKIKNYEQNKITDDLR